ncbi:D-cysteine desulfhydrase [Nocardioides hungaricus]
MALELARLPTPLHHVADLGAPGLTDLWLKRDDLTGWAWGGNKVRTVESVLADVLERRVGTVVVAGAPASNFAALLAVAAAGCGLAVHQVCHGRPRSATALALSRQAGAAVTFTGSDDKGSMETGAQALARELGGYAVPRGGASAVGARGFAVAAPELVAQLDEAGLGAVTVVLPVGSGGSIAGLLAGLARHGLDDRVRLVGVSATRAPDPERIIARATETARLLGGPDPGADLVLVDGRAGEDDGLAATLLRGSGFVADPVYNVKALRWLGRHRGELAGPVVYWSTGGLLAAADALTEESGT